MYTYLNGKSEEIKDLIGSFYHNIMFILSYDCG